VGKTTLRALIAIAAHYDLEIFQMDVTTAFLHPEIEDNIQVYMKQPKGMVVKGKEHLVCKLLKGLYGLKQASHLWYNDVCEQLISYGLKKSSFDPCVFYDDNGKSLTIVAIYVDDFIVVTDDKNMYNDLLKKLGSKYDMKDLGNATRFVGVEINRNRKDRTITLNQPAYVQHILERFNMTQCDSKPCPAMSSVIFSKADSPSTPDDKEHMLNTPYAEAVGALNWLATMTRPDIAQAVSVVARFTANPGYQHWNAVKFIFKYLKGTIFLGIIYGANHDSKCPLELVGYVDSDFAGCVDTRRSTTGFSFHLNGGTISWKSQKQSMVAQSTAEAEYIAASSASSEAVFLRGLLQEMKIDMSRPTTLWEDNNACISISKQMGCSGRTKHIDVKMHIIRDRIMAELIELMKISTNENVADMFTKALAIAKFRYFRSMLLGFTAIKMPER
jgi:hypothetical protein